MMSLNHADSLIPVLASLYHWTWFYWGQNRLGLPIALATSLIHNPLYNLIFQTILSCFLSLSSFPILTVFITGRRYASVVGLISTIFFVIAAPASFHRDFLSPAQSYGIGMTLALLGLLLLEEDVKVRRSWRWLGAALLLFLAQWANLAMFFFICPLAIFRSLLSTRNAFFAHERLGRYLTSWQWVALVVPTFAANYWIARNYPFQGSFATVPITQLPNGMLTLLHNTMTEFNPALTWVFAIVASITIIAAILHWKVVQSLLLGTLAVLTGMLGYLALAVVSTHVWESGLAYRYAIPAIITLLTVIVTVSLVPWMIKSHLFQQKQLTIEWALVVSLLLLSVARYGVPSPAVVRKIINERFGKRTVELLEAGCSTVMGQYWDVWEAVFHVNLTLYEVGQKRIVWGIGNRAQVTEGMWRPLVENRECVAVPATQASRSEIGMWIKTFRLPPLVLVPNKRTFKQILVLQSPIGSGR